MIRVKCVIAGLKIRSPLSRPFILSYGGIPAGPPCSECRPVLFRYYPPCYPLLSKAFRFEKRRTGLDTQAIPLSKSP